MDEEETDLRRVMGALEPLRIGAAMEEAELHEQAARAFEAAGLAALHEARIGLHCRIDFLVGSIGVEIKKNRPRRAALIAQLTRYAACPQVQELLVLAPRGVSLPKRIAGKRVTMMSLERLWGICLP